MTDENTTPKSEPKGEVPSGDKFTVLRESVDVDPVSLKPVSAQTVDDIAQSFGLGGQPTAGGSEGAPSAEGDSGSGQQASDGEAKE